MSFPHGFLIVNKPTGVTSFSMVALVRRLTGVRRVGHAGTLDPLASGVLPVAVGQATRFIEYLDEDDDGGAKQYVATVSFGAATDTYDGEGSVTAEADASGVSADSIQRVLPEFTGDVTQTPPRFSAIKVAGKPLYRYAREGADVSAPPRIVRIEGIELRSFGNATARLRVMCGKGTYIRSLAHDLGARLGCPAHLAALERTRSGGFTLEDAATPETLVAAATAGTLEELLLAPDRALERRPACIVAAGHAADIQTGRDVRFDPSRSARECRAYTIEGDFLGVLRGLPDGSWHPEKVLGSA